VSATRSLVVKVTVAGNDPERCWQGFQVASAGVALGAQVSLWLASEATSLALPGQAEALHLADAPPLADLRDAVIADGRIWVCSACASRRGIGPDDLLAGITIAGSAAFAEQALAPGAQALVY
jgi:predicted peroxiredoxin